MELARSAGGDRLSQQPAKWMFIDRMNGISRKEVLYRNTGLYQVCYAKGGEPFLRFMLANESNVRRKLSENKFTDDEIIAALCSPA